MNSINDIKKTKYSMHIKKSIKLQKEVTPLELALRPYFYY